MNQLYLHVQTDRQTDKVISINPSKCCVCWDRTVNVNGCGSQMVYGTGEFSFKVYMFSNFFIKCCPSKERTSKVIVFVIASKY